jgi:hypothetical protein
MSKTNTAAVLIRNDKGRLITTWRVESDATAADMAETAAALHPPGWTAEAITAGGAQLALHHAPEAQG